MSLRLAAWPLQAQYACCRASTSAAAIKVTSLASSTASSSSHHRLPPSALLSPSSSSASFHTSAPAQEKRRKRIARLKKQTNLSRRHRAQELLAATAPDPIRGYAKNNEKVWLESDLKKLLLDKESVWKGEIPELVVQGNSSGEGSQPTTTTTPYLNFGLNSSDSEFLFKQLPASSAFLEAKGGAGGAAAANLAASTLEQRLKRVEPLERNKTELMKRILDLRNANSRGIRFENTKRVVEHFSDQSKRDENGNVKPDPGRTEVQAAILTMRIHNLADHLATMPRDIHCRRGLRQLIMARAKLLKYLKRYSLERYVSCLKAIGVEQRAVEGEIILREENFRL